MTPRLQNVAPPEPGRLPTATVVGLEKGRDHARKLHRKKRRTEKARSGFYIALVIALLGGGAYAGYLFYGDFEDGEEQERQEIRAELDAERGGTGNDLLDSIDELETQPQFNGPGVPALGVGDEP